jgi:flagellar biosynthetic protein FliR
MLDWLTDDTVRVAADRSVLLFALVMARVAPIVQLAPFLGGRATPRSVKTSIAFALAILVAPMVWTPEFLLGDIGSGELGLLIAKELLVGLTLGFVAALIFEAVRMAGQIIDAARGQTMANVMVPQLPERASVSADLLYQFSIALFFVLGGHHVFVRALVRSYRMIPPTAFPIGEGDAIIFSIARLTADSIAIGLLLAFPVVAAILLADLVLALINKSAPQVNVFFLGMPAKALLGVAVVLFGLGVFADEFAAHAADNLESLDDLLQTIGGG